MLYAVHCMLGRCTVCYGGVLYVRTVYYIYVIVVYCMLWHNPKDHPSYFFSSDIPPKFPSALLGERLVLSPYLRIIVVNL